LKSSKSRPAAAKPALLAGGNPQIDIHEDDLDEAQMATRIEQASSIPGWETGDGSFRRRT